LSDKFTDERSLPTRFCVVGAGPNGLIAARALLRYGIQFDIYERHARAGGIWDIENPGSPIYESCHFITSKESGGFIGYPMPADYPDYPSWQQVRNYVWDMADAYGLNDLATYGVSVEYAEPVGNGPDTYWRVTLSTGEVKKYRGVVYAGGQQWTPFIPDIPGIKTFTGRFLHSSEYRKTDEFKDKRTVVIGAGNSGVDIAVDAALNGLSAYLSTRRAYHFFPKNIFGLPTPDLLNGKVSLPDIPMLSDLSNEQQLELVLATVGDLSRYGLPVPDKPVGSTHPIVSNTVLHCFSHGLLAHKPDISHVDGQRVCFVDGSSERADVIVAATGYDIKIPWLADGLVTYNQGHAKFHLGTFVDGIRGLYGVGMLHAAVAEAWALFDQFAQLMAADAYASLTGENAENMQTIREQYSPDLTGGFPFLDTRRNVNQSDVAALHAVLADLAEKFDISIPDPGDTGFYSSQLRPIAEVLAAR
jgi:hypothetical protein